MYHSSCTRKLFRCAASYLEQNPVLVLHTLVLQSSGGLHCSSCVHLPGIAFVTLVQTLQLHACRVFLLAPRLALCREAHACPSFAAASLLTSLALAVLPTGVFHTLPACLAVCLPVSLSDALFHAVASTVGAILVFPGASNIELGKSTPSPPFLAGLGWALAVSTIAPTFAVCGCALLYLLLRKMIMHKEDPLHNVLWVSLPLWVDAS